MCVFAIIMAHINWLFGYESKANYHPMSGNIKKGNWNAHSNKS